MALVLTNSYWGVWGGIELHLYQLAMENRHEGNLNKASTGQLSNIAASPPPQFVVVAVDIWFLGGQSGRKMLPIAAVDCHHSF